MSSWCRKCKRDGIVKRNFRKDKSFFTRADCNACGAQYRVEFDPNLGWCETLEEKKELLQETKKLPQMALKLV
jgi:hypothetical protein